MMGPVVLEEGLQLKVWVPHANAVSVELLASSEEVVRLPLSGEGEHWGGIVRGKLTTGSKYRFIVDSSHNDCYALEGALLERRDPYARETEFDSNWCMVPAPLQAFNWTAPTPPTEALVPWNKLNLYELHVGSFSQEGTFEGAVKHLDHIKQLGFTGVQLMPVTEFGGSWGYNPRQLLAVHGPWGSAHQLRTLIDRCQELGLAVLVDIVLNHGASNKNTLWMWDGYGRDNTGGIYFETGLDTPWGKQFAFDKPQVQSYLLDAARMWLKEYNVDGLRMDSVHNMPWSLLQDINHKLREEFPGKILVAEITPETPEAIKSAKFHSEWFHFPHFDTIKLIDGESDQWVKTVKCVTKLPSGYDDGFNGVSSILGSHDQIGCRKNGQRDGEGKLHRHFVDRVGGRGKWHARAQTRMWWAINATSRTIPMMFMGDEFLQGGFWHCDPANRGTWMQWPESIALDGSDLLHEAIPAGMDENTQWSLQMARCTRAVNLLRAGSSALTSHNYHVVHENFNMQVFAFVRWEGSQAMLVIANTSENQWEGERMYKIQVGGIPFTPNIATLEFNSQAAEFGGWEGSASSGSVNMENSSLTIHVPKWSVLVYSLE